MAGYIIFKEDAPICYHVPATFKRSSIDIDTVKAIQADGHELSQIKDEYPYFCSKTKRVQYFHGDIAKMIFINLLCE